MLPTSVHIPSTPTKKSLLPVIVYIHGGGWVFSFIIAETNSIRFPSYVSGNISSYPIGDFVKGSNYGVVSVGIQYRLGVFGELRVADSIWHTAKSLKHLVGFLPGQKVKDGGKLNAGLRESCLPNQESPLILYIS